MFDRCLAVTAVGGDRAWRASPRVVIRSKDGSPHIKRSYGWSRTELTGIHGARTWCGYGVFATTWSKSAASQHDPDTQTPRQHPASSKRSPCSSVISRSGIAMVGGLARGLSHRDAAR